MNRDVLWRILVLRGIHSNLVNLISGLYSGTENAVRYDGIVSDYFQLILGYVRDVFLPLHHSPHAWTMYWEDVGEIGLRSVVRNVCMFG